MSDPLKKVGEYSILVGNNPTKFWPLVPGTTVESATHDPQVAPNAQGNKNTVSTIAQPPVFCIFDILIKLSEEFKEDTVEAAKSSDKLRDVVTGKPVEKNMPMTLEDDGTVHICFGVPPNKGDLTIDRTKPGHFEGTLQLQAKHEPGGQHVNLKLPLKATKLTTAADMFIFFIVKDANKDYAWVKIKVVEASDGTTAVPGVKVRSKVLRVNPGDYSNINRRVDMLSGADGFVGFQSRPVLGLLAEWPIIFNAAEDDFSTYVPRGHMVKLTANSAKHNMAPLEFTGNKSNIRMTRVANADMSGKKVLLDPGHGVVYGFKARRSNEWYVAHKISDKIADLLTAKFNLPNDNVFWTRTAGFGLIDPHKVKENGAPEAGKARYEFDLPNKKVRAKLTSVALHDLSDLLLTRHTGYAKTTLASSPVPEADRQRLLDVNQRTIGDIVARINKALPVGRTVRRELVHWDPNGRAGKGDYVYSEERVAQRPPSGAAPPSPTLHDAGHFPITTSDWFSLDDDMFDVLAERSARWSLACEIDGDLPAAQITAAREAMHAGKALDYMVDLIKKYSTVAAPHEWLNHGTMGWGPTDRINYLNATDCDIYLTVHENTGRGKGGEVLVSVLNDAGNSPPDDQIRKGKIMVKYLDGFNQGVRQDGVTKEEATNQAGLLHGGNTRRENYCYFELEFVDASNPTPPPPYRFEQMVLPDFIERVAEQIAAGVIEILFDPQDALDPITLNGEFALW